MPILGTDREFFSRGTIPISPPAQNQGGLFVDPIVHGDVWASPLNPGRKIIAEKELANPEKRVIKSKN